MPIIEGVRGTVYAAQRPDHPPVASAQSAGVVQRDLEALEAVGFPLVNDRVDGQVRWRLMDVEEKR